MALVRSVGELGRYHVLVAVLPAFIMAGLKSPYINLDAYSYHYYYNYFSSLDFFDALVENPDIRIEFGYKIFLAAITRFPLQQNNVYIFVTLIHSLLSITLLHLVVSKLPMRSSLLYIFYLTFFYFVFELATVRHALASLLLLYAFTLLVYSRKMWPGSICLILAASLHYGVLLVGLIILGFIVDRSRKIFSIRFFLGVLCVLMLRVFIQHLLPFLGEYYQSFFNSNGGGAGGAGLRWLPELIVVGFCIYCMKKETSPAIIKFVTIATKVYLITLAITLCFYGVPIFSRLRVTAWLLMVVCVGLLWSRGRMHVGQKMFVSTYAVAMLMYQASVGLMTWHLDEGLPNIE